jgi:hypothetical protein
MENKLLFKAKGMKDSASGGFGMAGIIIFLVFGIMAFLADGKIGPWYYYAIAFVFCIFITYNAARKHRIEVNLEEISRTEVRLSIAGIANNVDFAVEEYSCWYVVKHRSAKYGGTEVRLHFHAKGNADDELCFTQLIPPENKPKGWSQHTREFHLDQKVFMVPELVTLAKALDDHERRSHKN